MRMAPEWRSPVVRNQVRVAFAPTLHDGHKLRQRLGGLRPGNRSAGNSVSVREFPHNMLNRTRGNSAARRLVSSFSVRFPDQSERPLPAVS
jgi:hypothetical protein